MIRHVTDDSMAQTKSFTFGIQIITRIKTWVGSLGCFKDATKILFERFCLTWVVCLHTNRHKEVK